MDSAPGVRLPVLDAPPTGPDVRVPTPGAPSPDLGSRLPIRVLLQRTTQEQPRTAPLDFAASPNIPEVRSQHEESGARTVAEFPYWTVMRDPDDG
ncbi:VOC family protein, partial [Streptomyces acidiscabies]|uniref:VOC family protein n=1 Tax=Streptomyces acidiscabies TaxID=42234 RepID=UPI000A48CE47